MKVYVPLGKPRPWVLPVTLVCLALGALIASLMNAAHYPAGDADLRNLRPEDQARYYKRQVEGLQSEINKLRGRVDDMVDAATSDQKLKVGLQKEINDLRVLAGSTPVEGPGIVVTIDDSRSVPLNPAEVNVNPLLTHDTDLLQIVNELRAAGAEAIAINEQRVVGSTAIRCVGPVIHVNNRPISSPFVIKAIGDTDALYGAVNLPFGVLDQLKQLEIAVETVKREKIRVPAVTIMPSLAAGKVVIEKEGAHKENK